MSNARHCGGSNLALVNGMRLELSISSWSRVFAGRGSGLKPGGKSLLTFSTREMSYLAAGAAEPPLDDGGCACADEDPVGLGCSELPHAATVTAPRPTATSNEAICPAACLRG